MLCKGHFITIEGIDGSGKSTLAHGIAQALAKHNVSILLTKEPGGSELGKQLRNILQTQATPVCDKTEFLLFAADRAQHYTHVILPALQAGSLVISDRWADSSVAYQGYGRGLDVEVIKSINAWATNNISPDLTFYVRIDAKTALERINKRQETLTAFEKEKFEFWSKVISGYEEMYSRRKEVVILDGQLGQLELLELALKALNERLWKK